MKKVLGGFFIVIFAVALIFVGRFYWHYDGEFFEKQHEEFITLYIAALFGEERAKYDMGLIYELEFKMERYKKSNLIEEYKKRSRYWYEKTELTKEEIRVKLQ